MNARGFRSDLLAWYDAQRRDLPWRRTDDPYAILVSEVMLQQTQVARVEEYWPRFLDRFPTLDSLASASEDEVCAAWSGLGYYRRARNLRKAAIAIAGGGGCVPETADELRELPGVGEYTSAAVASIAFGEAVPVLDANVVRALARLSAEARDATRATARQRLRALAARLIDPGRPGDFNQAMMELGALVCTPRAPGCETCPVSQHCLAREDGDPERFPPARPAGGPNEMRETAALAARRGRVLLTREPDERGWWPGLWRLPRVIVSESRADGGRTDGGSGGSREGDDPAAALRERLERSYGLTCDDLTPLPAVTYGVTTNRVRLVVLVCRTPRGRLRRTPDVRWVAPGQALTLGLPAADRRILESFEP